MQSEVLPAGGAAVGCLCAVDAAVSGEAGAEAEGFWTLWAPVGLLSTVGVAVVLEQLLQTVALPADVAAERPLAGVAPLVNFDL